jgi:hypothetical protein
MPSDLNQFPMHHRVARLLQHPGNPFRLLLFVLTIFIGACGNNSGPDVSDININLQTQRFEQDFFALDTTAFEQSLTKLNEKYPLFFPDFVEKVLGLPPLRAGMPETSEMLKKFLSDYRPVKDSADKVFNDFEKYNRETIEGLKHVKHYFPAYKTPEKLITFIGPMDAYFEASTGGYGDALTTNALIVGLQLHLGSRFSMYTSEMGQSLYPAYISRKFAPEYIPVNCIKNVIDDMYPENTTGKSLVEKMVEKGKRLYVLNKLMPETPDTLKIGYTDKQLKGCYENEGLIWNFILTNSLAYNTDPSVIKGYIGEAPNTPELGEGSPGYIALFLGQRIVEKFMEKNDGMQLDSLMRMDPRTIFEQSKYRPK